MTGIKEQMREMARNKAAIAVIVVLAMMGKIATYTSNTMWLVVFVGVALAFNAKLKTSEITKQANIMEAAGNTIAFGLVFIVVAILQSMSIGVLNMDEAIMSLKLGVVATAISEAYGMVVHSRTG